MSHPLLGRVAPMSVERVGAPGAFLIEPGGDPRDAVLLPRAELIEPVQPGDRVEVFLYLDSEERPTATLKKPRLTLGEVAFLQVTAVNNIGAFVDWGLGKELLVPFAEQTAELYVGDRHAIGLYLDSSRRLAGTMRISEMLDEQGSYQRDQWVEGEAWRKRDGVGVFVILERRHVGLLPDDEPHKLRRGDAARFRIASVLPDGRVELSLRDFTHNAIDADADALLAYLADPRNPRLGDRSDPELIRSRTGLSKKAFKRALGRLLLRRAVDVDAQGLPSLAQSAAPAAPTAPAAPATPAAPAPSPEPRGQPVAKPTTPVLRRRKP